MRIVEDTKLDFSDVLILPKRSTLTSRKEVSLEKTYTFKHSKLTWTGVPIVASNMDGVGTLSMAQTLSDYKCLTALVKHLSPKDVQDFKPQSWDYVMFSTGITDNNLAELDRILSQHTETKFVCIDVANGYTEMFVEACRNFRSKYPNITIIAGNVVTPEMTEELLLNGVDIVKVGIGPGSVCTTRLKTGVGYPQLSAIIECADAAHGLGGHIIADGGCTSPGDIAKAFGAGADYVMMGGYFAKAFEAETHQIGDGTYWGGASHKQQILSTGKVYRHSEGKEVPILEQLSPLEVLVDELWGGISSAISCGLSSGISSGISSIFNSSSLPSDRKSTRLNSSHT